jgi:hypothetical protein
MNEAAELHRSEAARHRKRSRVGTIVLALFITAAVATFVLGSARSKIGPGIIVPSFVLFGGAIVAMIFVISVLDKARRHDVGAALAEKGMEVDHAPPKERRGGHFAPFASLKALRHGAKGVRIWAGGAVEGRQVFLIDHAYTVHTGKSNHTVHHTAAATACPAQWPVVSLKGQNLVTGWWANLHGRDMTLENEAFNKRWIVRAENEDFALLVLSPQVQEFLCNAPSGETWQIGHGWICWYRQKGLQIDNADVPVERLMGLVRLLPAELAHWGS